MARLAVKRLAIFSLAHFLNYGPKPILIDEWQHVSFIWDQVKYELDRTAIRTKETRHFTDPSIGAAALGITPEGIFKDITTFGRLFESLVVIRLHIRWKMVFMWYHWDV